MPLPFAHRTMLAPMEGVSHPLLRDLMARRPGVGIVCTEFVRITSDPYPPAKLARVVKKSPGVPLSVQVMGRDLERLADAARVVSAAGADVVDINLGCPSRNAARAGVGAAILREPGVLREVVGAVRQAALGPVSAKLRAGFHDTAQVVHLAETAQAAGADYLVVHPRRRVDLFQGVADWRIVRVLKASLDVPIVGNGDVWYAIDALRLEVETGCDGVMLGRPALRNPWIFEQIACLRRGHTPPRPSGEEVFAWIAALVDGYRAHFGRGALGRLKEVLAYLGRAVPDRGVFRTACLRAPSLDALLEECNALRRLPARALDLGPEGEHGLERSARGV